MITTHLEKDTCPSCGKILDAASPVDGESAPGPNDLVICIHCFSWNKYGEDMKLVSLTQEEIDNMDPVMQKELDETRSTIVNMIKQVRDAN